MSLLRSSLTLARNGRSFVTSSAFRSSAKEVNPGYRKIQDKANRFLMDDGTPVHVKGGALDSILYRLTMAACIGAVVWDVALYWELAQK